MLADAKAEPSSLSPSQPNKMLPKERRIPRSLFQTLINPGNGSAKPRFSNSKHFSLRVAGASESPARVAVSVSKKVSKSAVLRNRTRRRAYSAISALLPGLKPGLYFVSAKPGADKLAGAELKAELEELFSLGAFVRSSKKG
jgi:ribonuclease P protein component